MGSGAVALFVDCGWKPVSAQVSIPKASVPSGTANPKAFINYFLPTPIHGQLIPDAWGASQVGSRDQCINTAFFCQACKQ